MKRIFVLWPTVRPATLFSTLAAWAANVANRNNVKYLIDIHTTEIGVCESLYTLSRSLNCDDTDIIMIGMDDVFPPVGWDEIVLKEFENYDGAIEVNDGGIRNDRPIYTSGILTYSTLKKLNFITAHPDYYHCWSDNELYDNLMELGLLKDVSKTNPAIFEHRHFNTGKRARDGVDQIIAERSFEDEKTYRRRKQLPLSERLIYSTTTKGAA